MNSNVTLFSAVLAYALFVLGCNQQQINDLNSQNETLIKENAAIEDALRVAETKIKVANSEITDLTHRYSAGESELKAAHDKIGNQQIKIKAGEDRLSAVESEFKTELRTVDSKFKTTESKLKVAQIELKAAKSKIAKIENAPKNLFENAVRVRLSGDLKGAVKMLYALEQRFPDDPVTKRIQAERKMIKTQEDEIKAKLKKEYDEILLKAKNGDLMEGVSTLEEYAQSNPSSPYAADAKKEAKNLKIKALKKAYMEILAKAKSGDLIKGAKILSEYAEKNPTSPHAIEAKKAAVSMEEEAKRPPVEILFKTFERGNPALLEVRVKNTSGKTIKGIKLSTELVNNFGDRVGFFKGVMQDPFYAGATDTFTWKIFAFATATDITEFKVDEIAFSFGPKWTAPEK